MFFIYEVNISFISFPHCPFPLHLCFQCVSPRGAPQCSPSKCHRQRPDQPVHHDPVAASAGKPPERHPQGLHCPVKPLRLCLFSETHIFPTFYHKHGKLCGLIKSLLNSFGWTGLNQISFLDECVFFFHFSFQILNICVCQSILKVSHQAVCVHMHLDYYSLLNAVDLKGFVWKKTTV